MLVPLLFFLSGATALVYEVIWSRYLSLIFGSTIQAQTVVLAGFMGGLALGNHFFGRWADALKRPLLAYGYLELIIGIYAFFFSSLYGMADHLFIAWGRPLISHPAALLGLKGLISASLLLGPTLLMGGTLPLLASWLLSQSSEPGRLSARFYSINSLGAVFGAFMAGFVLIHELGMVASLQATALVNFIIGITAIGIARAEHPKPLPILPAPGALESAEERLERSTLLRGCIIVSITGAASMGLEVLASRSLALIFGASLQAFATVLIAFILGIGLGSGFIASRRSASREETAAALLLAASLFIAIFIASIEHWTVIYAQLKKGFAANEMGYRFHECLLAGISIITLGLPAALIGTVLPLWIKIHKHGPLAKRVGLLLTCNTAGAVGGVLLTGFVLMPLLGLRAAIAAVSISLAAAGLWCAARSRNRPQILAGAALMVIVAILGATGTEQWRNVLGSGVFRMRNTNVTWASMKQRKDFIKLLFYEDGPDATVSVETAKTNMGPSELVLRINGKPDASTRGDLSTQYLLAHLPLLARPESKEVFVLGFGSGITAGALLGHPLDRLTVAENCAPILRAGKLFESWNRGVLTNSRTRIMHEDARTVLKLSPDSYDVIISEPSNPWVAGIGSVFSVEFYQIASARLKEGGIMAQWFHIYEMHDGIVNLILRTFGTVFPYVEVWDTQTGDVILLGSKTPWKGGIESYRQVFAREGPRRDLERIGLHSPESILARQLASQNTGFAIPGDGALQLDEFPILEYEAPKAFFTAESATEPFLFDERTLQSALAPPEKRRILQSLSDPMLLSVFAEFSSANSVLVGYLKWRNSVAGATGRHAVFPNNSYLPLIFRSPDSYPGAAEIPPGASSEFASLLKAEGLLYASPERWSESVQTVENVLGGAPVAASRDWLPAYFAALGVRACYEHHELQRAQALLAVGLKLAPGNNQLEYLNRVLSRMRS